MPPETGPLYDELKSTTEFALQPIDDLANEIANRVTVDPVEYANTIVGEVAVLWGYLSYFEDITPSLLSLSLLLTAFLIVMLVKLIMSVVMYAKHLIAQWI